MAIFGKSKVGNTCLKGPFISGLKVKVDFYIFAWFLATFY